MCFLEDWMKKIFAMCVMSAFLFAACGGDDSSSASPDEPVSSSTEKKSPTIQAILSFMNITEESN